MFFALATGRGKYGSYYPGGGFKVRITGIATSPMNFLTSVIFYCIAKSLSKDTEWYKRIP